MVSPSGLFVLCVLAPLALRATRAGSTICFGSWFRHPVCLSVLGPSDLCARRAWLHGRDGCRLVLLAAGSGLVLAVSLNDTSWDWPDREGPRPGRVERASARRSVCCASPQAGAIARYGREGENVLIEEDTVCRPVPGSACFCDIVDRRFVRGQHLVFVASVSDCDDRGCL